jgi:hypothetical protein
VPRNNRQHIHTEKPQTQSCSCFCCRPCLQIPLWSQGPISNLQLIVDSPYQKTKHKTPNTMLSDQHSRQTKPLMPVPITCHLSNDRTMHPCALAGYTPMLTTCFTLPSYDISSYLLIIGRFQRLQTRMPSTSPWLCVSLLLSQRQPDKATLVI